VVTAVDSPEDDGVRPSRFLAELGVPVAHVRDRPRRPLTLPALVAELRSTATDTSQPEHLRRAACDRLAVLAGARHGTTPLVPGAHPDQWWGLVDVSDPGRPMFPADQQVRLSGSALAAISECPLRWFLDHEVRAQRARSVALGFGSIVHALARDVAVGASPPELPRLLELLDSVWGKLGFDARWRSTAERECAASALSRFLDWHLADRGRELVAAEHRFAVELTVAGRPVVMTGSIDRVEIDADGFVHVVDLKTGRQVPVKSAVDTHVQLGVYQRSVQSGAVAEAAGSTVSAGAELVQLRTPERSGNDCAPLVLGQPPLAIDDQAKTWIDSLLDSAVVRMSDEHFPAVVCSHCRYCDFRPTCPAHADGRQLVS
jgi:RecB family exonuclease